MLKVVSLEEEGLEVAMRYFKWKKYLYFVWFRNAQFFSVILLYHAWVPAAIDLKTTENTQTLTSPVNPLVYIEA